MIGVKRYLRLRYVSDTALENMLKAGTAICNDAEFALTIRPGDGIILANLDESVQIGRVKSIGLAMTAANHGEEPQVTWKRTSFDLYPSQQGLRFWRQAKPFFVFAKDVAVRYRLPEIFDKAFDNFVQFAPALAPEATYASPSRSRFKVSDPSGYVYLIRSPYGYKIGKTKRMKERSQLFSVKLPFEFEIIHYAWFADYSTAENMLHRRYSHKRLGGEWFDLDHAEIEEIKRFT